MSRSARAKDAVAHVLAVWFGCGHVPFAPGTAGTLGALPLYLVLRPHGLAAVALGALGVSVVGIWASTRVARRLGATDPQIVCIDEVAGVLVTWLAAPAGWRGVAAGFVIFRVLDQLKPWPARVVERRWREGWGIVGDDLVAGAWGAAGLALARYAGWL